MGISFPVKVEGHLISATLDTGAGMTCLSEEFANAHQLKQGEAIDYVLADQANGRAPTCTVELECAGKRLLINALVLPLPGTILLVGRDLMSSLGIKIEGLPLEFHPALVEDPVDILQEPDPSPFRESVMEGIKAVFQTNQAIDRYQLCTLPYAWVSLDTGTHQPVNRRQYPIPQAIIQDVGAKIADWLNLGVICKAPVESCWNSPLLAAPKKDDNGLMTKIRLCLDTRGLNGCLQDLRYELPLVRDVFKRISGFKLASRLDLAESFHQLPIVETDRVKTTFTFAGKRYMFRGAPFGIKTLSSHLQRVLSILLEPLQEFCVHFVDDIVIFSDSLTTHINHLKLVIGVLNDANLKLNGGKCLFAMEKLNLLGHVVSGDSIRADPAKLSAFAELPEPTTGKEVESLLGVAGYLRDYIPCFSRLVAPLEAIRKCRGALGNKWTPECAQAVCNLKQVLSTPPFLHKADFEYPFTVGTDASDYGIGAVLYQTIDGATRFISLMSKALSPSQRNYCVTKKELLAIVLALKYFREWIWGKHFTLLTDHRSLVYLLSSRQENRMLANWAEYLLEHDFEVIHCPGILHILPDYLSRIYHQLTKGDEPTLQLVEPSVTKPHHVLAKHVREVLGKTIPSNQPEILAHHHSMNHHGASQLFQKVFDAGFYWPSLRKDCMEVVANCRPCLQYNIAKSGFKPLQPIQAERPMDHVAIDLFGPFEPAVTTGNTFTLVMVDIATRYCWLVPLRDKSAPCVAEALFKLFCGFGFPRIIQSDNGTEFVNSITKAWFAQTGVTHRLITPYHPQANGAAERHVSESKTLLNKLLMGDESDWDAYLPAVQYGLNSRISSRHKSRPFTLFFGRVANNFQDYRESVSSPVTEQALLEHARTMSEIVFPSIARLTDEYNAILEQRFAKSHTLTSTFPVDSRVMRKNIHRKNKGDPRWLGPYLVKELRRNGSYVLLDAEGEQLPAAIPQDQLRRVPDASPEVVPFYEIADILDHRGIGDNREYLVSWANHNDSANTWVSVYDLDATDLIREYHQEMCAGVVSRDGNWIPNPSQEGRR